MGCVVGPVRSCKRNVVSIAGLIPIARPPAGAHVVVPDIA